MNALPRRHLLSIPKINYFVFILPSLLLRIYLVLMFQGLEGFMSKIIVISCWHIEKLWSSKSRFKFNFSLLYFYNDRFFHNLFSFFIRNSGELFSIKFINTSTKHYTFILFTAKMKIINIVCLILIEILHRY